MFLRGDSFFVGCIEAGIFAFPRVWGFGKLSYGLPLWILSTTWAHFLEGFVLHLTNMLVAIDVFVTIRYCINSIGSIDNCGTQHQPIAFGDCGFASLDDPKLLCHQLIPESFWKNIESNEKSLFSSKGWTTLPCIRSSLFFFLCMIRRQGMMVQHLRRVSS